MPIYEYVAEQCRRAQPCPRRMEYLQQITEPALTACRDCGAPIIRVLSAFAARSGGVGLSTPDPTPLNITGIPAPSAPPGPEGGCGHDH